MQEGIYRELLTMKQAQLYMKCCRSFLINKRKSGEIEYIKAGKKVLIPKLSIDKYLGINQQEVSNG